MTDRSDRAKACLTELQQVLDRHGFVLSHEDSQGAFILEDTEALTDKQKEHFVAWLAHADVAQEPDPDDTQTVRVREPWDPR